MPEPYFHAAVRGVGGFGGVLVGLVSASLIAEFNPHADLVTLVFSASIVAMATVVAFALVWPVLPRSGREAGLGASVGGAAGALSVGVMQRTHSHQHPMILHR